MTFAQTVLLGSIAGFTIFLGLPIGRVKGISEKTRSFLSMTSTGILLFLFFDIFKQLSEPVEAALDPFHPGEFSVLLVVFMVGLGMDLLGLIFFEQRLIRSRLTAG